jgi:hypothetical protein
MAGDPEMSRATALVLLLGLYLFVGLICFAVYQTAQAFVFFPFIVAAIGIAIFAVTTALTLVLLFIIIATGKTMLSLT